MRDVSLLMGQKRALLIRVCLRMLAILPLKMLQGIGALLGEVLWRLPTRARSTALVNIELCFPELSRENQLGLARRSLHETAKTFVEMAAIWHWSTTKLKQTIIHVDGQDCLDKALAAGQGVIILAPHYGQWEVLNAYVGQHYPLTALYRPPKLSALEPVIRDARQRFGSQLVPTSRQGVKQLFAALRASQMIGILPDQEPTKQHGAGVFAPFFSVPAWSMTLLSRLAYKSQAQVVIAGARRLAGGEGYALSFFRLDERIRAEDLSVSVGYLNQAVETLARQCPAQYQWSYKRFKTRPPGEAKLYPK